MIGRQERTETGASGDDPDALFLGEPDRNSAVTREGTLLLVFALSKGTMFNWLANQLHTVLLSQ